LLCMFGLPCFALILLLSWRDMPPSLFQLISAFELALPLVAGLSASPLMTIEQEEGFDLLRNSYPELSWRVPLLRTFGALLLIGLCLLIGLISFRVLYGGFDLVEVVLPALPPTLYLTGFALLVGNVTRNAWAAYAAVIGYWAMDFQLGGTVTRTLFLFNKSYPRMDVNYDLNRSMLVIVGIGFILANFAVYRLHRRGR